MNKQNEVKHTQIRRAGTNESSYLRWIWDCPQCGQRAVSLHHQNESKEDIEKDPMCWRCRPKKARAAIAKATGK